MSFLLSLPTQRDIAKNLIVSGVGAFILKTLPGINDDSNYNGTNSNTLSLINIPSAWYGYQYRCIVDGNSGRKYSLQFQNTWTGITSNDWGNITNWSCGTLPDANTDVSIDSGTVILNSNTTVRSLTVKPGAMLTVATGVTLTVTH